MLAVNVPAAAAASQHRRGGAGGAFLPSAAALPMHALLFCPAMHAFRPAAHVVLPCIAHQSPMNMPSLCLQVKLCSVVMKAVQSGRPGLECSCESGGRADCTIACWQV